MILFDRSARVVFGRLSDVGREVSGLRIKFKIESSTEAVPNKATIQIYNLSESNRKLAEQAGNIIALDVGYGGNLENLFAGDVSRCISREEGPDTITEFECGDGEVAYNQNVDMSFGPGSDVIAVVKTLMKQLGLTKGQQDGLSAKPYPHGLTISGGVGHTMDFVMSKLNLEWSIQQGALQIMKKGKSTPETAVVISPTTGLIGSPKLKTKGGLDFTCLLQPQIKPGRAVELKTLHLHLVCRTEKVTHEGDTHDKQWVTQVESK